MEPNERPRNNSAALISEASARSTPRGMESICTRRCRSNWRAAWGSGCSADSTLLRTQKKNCTWCIKMLKNALFKDSEYTPTEREKACTRHLPREGLAPGCLNDPRSQWKWTRRLSEWSGGKTWTAPPRGDREMANERVRGC